jgi:Domain of unknown function (DUF4124)
MMLAPALRLALPLALAGTFGLQCAQADIFTWVDASGSINVSNLAPPDNARVIKVTKESARPAAGDDATPDATALAARVRQLEREVELARRPVPPPADYAPTPAYAPMPAPPTVQYNVQYIVEAPQPPMQYAASDYPPAYNNGCDSTWGNCGFGWSPGFYPSSVVVLQQPNFRRVRPSPHGRPFVPHAAPVLPPLIGPIQPLSTPIVSPLAMPRPPTASFRKG